MVSEGPETGARLPCLGCAGMSPCPPSRRRAVQPLARPGPAWANLGPHGLADPDWLKRRQRIIFFEGNPE